MMVLDRTGAGACQRHLVFSSRHEFIASVSCLIHRCYMGNKKKQKKLVREKERRRDREREKVRQVER